MSDIVQIVGSRIRTIRNQRNMTQEELAEKASLHPTYIGQVERGEKNLTLTSLEKIVAALEISFSDLFEDMEPSSLGQSLPSQCYEIIHKKTPAMQRSIYNILLEIDHITK